MIENVLLFRTKEKYIDPRYRKQIEEWDKRQIVKTARKNIETAENVSSAASSLAKGHLAKAYGEAAKIAFRIRGEIDELDTSTFPIIVFFALLIDSFEILGDLVPPLLVVLLPLAKIGSFVLFLSLIFNGRYFYRTFARSASFVILWLLNLLPLMDFLPFETIAVVLIWKKIAKMREEKEEEESEFEKNSVPVLRESAYQTVYVESEVQNEVKNVENEIHNSLHQNKIAA